MHGHCPGPGDGGPVTHGQHCRGRGDTFAVSLCREGTPLQCPCVGAILAMPSGPGDGRTAVPSLLCPIAFHPGPTCPVHPTGPR